MYAAEIGGVDPKNLTAQIALSGRVTPSFGTALHLNVKIRSREMFVFVDLVPIRFFLKKM